MLPVGRRISRGGLREPKELDVPAVSFMMVELSLEFEPPVASTSRSGLAMQPRWCCCRVGCGTLLKQKMHSALGTCTTHTHNRDPRKELTMTRTRSGLSISNLAVGLVLGKVLHPGLTLDKGALEAASMRALCGVLPVLTHWHPLVTPLVVAPHRLAEKIHLLHTRACVCVRAQVCARVCILCADTRCRARS